MVAELDLTDQDVTAIAAMIDAEISAHIPEWMSGEALDSHVNELALECHDSEAEDVHSSLPNESDSPLVLERLPSGRKYWRSPRQTGEESPPWPAQSNAAAEFNLCVSDDVSVEVCEGKDVSLNNNDQREYHSHGSTSSNQQKDSPHSNGSVKDNLEIDSPSASPDLQNPSPADMVNRDNEVASFCHLCYHPHGATDEQCGGDDEKLPDTLLESESEDVRSVVQKLENLLVQQQKEIDELKKKHEIAITDVLKGLPRHLRRRMLDKFDLKINNKKVHY